MDELRVRRMLWRALYDLVEDVPPGLRGPAMLGLLIAWQAGLIVVMPWPEER